MHTVTTYSFVITITYTSSYYWNAVLAFSSTKDKWAITATLPRGTKTYYRVFFFIALQLRWWKFYEILWISSETIPMNFEPPMNAGWIFRSSTFFSPFYVRMVWKLVLKLHLPSEALTASGGKCSNIPWCTFIKMSLVSMWISNRFSCTAVPRSHNSTIAEPCLWARVCVSNFCLFLLANGNMMQEGQSTQIMEPRALCCHVLDIEMQNSLTYQ